MTGEGARWLEVLALELLADRAIVCVRVEDVDLLLIRSGERIMACERACPPEKTLKLLAFMTVKMRAEDAIVILSTMRFDPAAVSAEVLGEPARHVVDVNPHVESFSARPGLGQSNSGPPPCETRNAGLL
jgi:hypothetical protein